tara:strand:- start:2750 stop:3160 length:411 start_codon:yes stop_codon:yes gene_type:complete
MNSITVYIIGDKVDNAYMFHLIFNGKVSQYCLCNFDIQKQSGAVKLSNFKNLSVLQGHEILLRLLANYHTLEDTYYSNNCDWNDLRIFIIRALQLSFDQVSADREKHDDEITVVRLTAKSAKTVTKIGNDFVRWRE